MSQLRNESTGAIGDSMGYKEESCFVELKFAIDKTDRVEVERLVPRRVDLKSLLACVYLGFEDFPSIKKYLVTSEEAQKNQQKERTEIIALLLEHGLRPHGYSQKDLRELFEEIVWLGNINLVEAFIKAYKKDVLASCSSFTFFDYESERNIRDYLSVTSEANEKQEIIALLFEHGLGLQDTDPIYLYGFFEDIVSLGNIRLVKAFIKAYRKDVLDYCSLWLISLGHRTTALDCAAQQGNIELCELLMDEGIGLQEDSEGILTAIREAKDEKTKNFIAEHWLKIKKPVNPMLQQLKKAVEEGNYEEVKRLVSANDLDLASEEARRLGLVNLQYFSADSNGYDIASLLLEKGYVPIGAVSDHLVPTMEYIIKAGHARFMFALLKYYPASRELIRSYPFTGCIGYGKTLLSVASGNVLEVMKEFEEEEDTTNIQPHYRINGIDPGVAKNTEEIKSIAGSLDTTLSSIDTIEEHISQQSSPPDPGIMPFGYKEPNLWLLSMTCFTSLFFNQGLTTNMRRVLAPIVPGFQALRCASRETSVNSVATERTTVSAGRPRLTAANNIDD